MRPTTSAPVRTPTRSGFLIGAVRRGTGTSGVQAELVNRVEAVARRMTGRSSEVERGISDGEAAG